MGFGRTKPMTPAVYTILQELRKLTYDELGELEVLIKPLRQQKYTEETPARETRWKIERAAAEAKKKKEQAAEPARVAFVKTLLKVGMWVKFKGCRDRGIREVETIHDKQNTVTGWQLQCHYRERNPDKLTRSGQVTTNAIANITHIWSPTYREWSSIKQLQTNS